MCNYIIDRAFNNIVDWGHTENYSNANLYILSFLQSLEKGKKKPIIIPF